MPAQRANHSHSIPDVALVDLDFRRPTVAEVFEIPPSPGATSVAAGHASLSEALIDFSFDEGGMLERYEGEAMAMGGEGMVDQAGI